MCIRDSLYVCAGNICREDNLRILRLDSRFQRIGVVDLRYVCFDVVERGFRVCKRSRNVRNGLAVVTVKRDACGGCFNRIPPQRQADIRQGKKIIVCEYCGRILVADPEAEQE